MLNIRLNAKLIHMKKLLLILIISFAFGNNIFGQLATTKKLKMNINLETATLANGCFWCTEAIFQRLKGVVSVKSGYTGGHLNNPSYSDVITGTTGHAEAIEIKFNPKIISFQEIVDVFFSTHDPTTLNRQGYDVGNQYRSAIFYHSEKQKEIAEKFIFELTKAQVFDNKIVTQIVPFSTFYAAENYHQDYYNNNKNQGYCLAVINPKLKKFIKKYKAKLKEE
jgi:peptide-methionine (S)-S-oxide reductase